MRNLNNWVKNQLIEQAFSIKSSSSKRGDKEGGISVLDFCCGKGGDLFKWMKSRKGGKLDIYLLVYLSTNLYYDHNF
jgi:ubiquinone/menaquinone biosynthesis C-methylase UbiE